MKFIASPGPTLFARSIREFAKIFSREKFPLYGSTCYNVESALSPFSVYPFTFYVDFLVGQFGYLWRVLHEGEDLNRPTHLLRCSHACAELLANAGGDIRHCSVRVARSLRFVAVAHTVISGRAYSDLLLLCDS